MPIAKKTSKNQITLPKSVVERFPGIDYFEVREEGGTIVLSPVVPGRADEVRRRLAGMGIAEEDIADAIRWARRK